MKTSDAISKKQLGNVLRMKQVSMFLFRIAIAQLIILVSNFIYLHSDAFYLLRQRM